jgi:hypothetical protein
VDGSWYCATVLDSRPADPPQVLVTFDGYDETHDKWVDARGAGIAPLHRFTTPQLKDGAEADGADDAKHAGDHSSNSTTPTHNASAATDKSWYMHTPGNPIDTILKGMTPAHMARRIIELEHQNQHLKAKLKGMTDDLNVSMADLRNIVPPSADSTLK